MVPGAGPGGPVPLRARTAELRGPAHRLPRSPSVETKVPLLSPVRAPLWSLSAFWPNGVSSPNTVNGDARHEGGAAAVISP